MSDIKLSNMSGKYITVDNETKNIKLKSKNKSSEQLLSYSTQGELIMKNKCVTKPQEVNTPLYLSDCVGSNNQKWIMSGNSLKSDDNKCVSYDDSNTIVSKSCDNSDEQSWQSEMSSESSTDSIKWTDYFGKTVVLVEADDPWYLNKDTTIQMPYIKNELQQDLKYRENADYKSGVVLDTSLPNLGRGYSYASRVGQPCQKIEGFGISDNSDNSPNLLMLLICILLLIFVYKTFQK